MNFDEAIHRIKERIKNPLPGKNAQLKMSPQPVDERRFDLLTPKSHRKGAVLLMIYPEGNQAFFPLIKRPNYPGVHGGQIALPGGKMDPTDADLIYTALREAEEEVAINPQKVTVLGSLTDLYIPASNFLVKPVIAFSEEIPDFVPEAREVQQILPTPLLSLFDKGILMRKKLIVNQGLELDTPYFEIQKEMVWGATAMILSEFLEILQSE
ncbi:MAG: NUDIX hydrolase [Bacteroidota bacterium]